MKTRLPIHCCCNPEVLLGSVEVPGNTRPGTVVRFSMQTFLRSLDPAVTTIPIETIELEAEELRSASGHRKLALKSNHLPVETLERIPSFRNAAGLVGGEE